MVDYWFEQEQDTQEEIENFSESRNWGSFNYDDNLSYLDYCTHLNFYHRLNLNYFLSLSKDVWLVKKGYYKHPLRIKRSKFQKLSKLNINIMNDLINNNYVVAKYFDNISDGFASSKYLSKEDAEKILNTKKQGYLTSFAIVEHTSIIGIITFNNHKAYIFNNFIYEKCNDAIKVTAEVYEELMNCYVFKSYEISKKTLEKLESEYYQRGGKLYPYYHDFENEVLKPNRKKRQQEFRNEIICHLFKHNFREVGKNKWSNEEGVIIKEISTTHISSKYNFVKNYLDMDIDFKYKFYISALFSKYLKQVNQFDENKFCIPCIKNKIQKYNFVCFDLEFKLNK
jgi:hypothetical protein